MRVLILGAYGLIGTPVLLRVLSAGHAVVGLGRGVTRARRRYPEVSWVEHDIAQLTRPEDWSALIASVDAVVNCSGALQDSARDNVQAVQSDSMRALFQACERAGVRRVVQVSAVGASLEAKTAFLRTKGEADDALLRLDLDGVVLRPGLVLAPAAYGATALLRALASVPLITPIASGEQPIQTVHVDEVADAVLAALEGRVPIRAAYDLVEDTPHTLVEIVAAWRSWLGYSRAPIVRIPRGLARLLFRIGDALAALGWRSPLRTTALQQIEAGVTGDPQAWTRATGEPLSGLTRSLRRLPATVQERWFGRLWLLKPLVISSLAVFWLVSGLIGLGMFEAANSVLTTRGIEVKTAVVLVVLGALLDLALGIAILFRRVMPWAALGMTATTVAYVLAASLVAPDLWADPLGPLMKTVPGAALALVAFAIADER